MPHIKQGEQVEFIENESLLRDIPRTMVTTVMAYRGHPARVLDTWTTPTGSGIAEIRFADGYQTKVTHEMIRRLRE